MSWLHSTFANIRHFWIFKTLKKTYLAIFVHRLVAAPLNPCILALAKHPFWVQLLAKKRETKKKNIIKNNWIVSIWFQAFLEVEAIAFFNNNLINDLPSAFCSPELSDSCRFRFGSYIKNGTKTWSKISWIIMNIDCFRRDDGYHFPFHTSHIRNMNNKRLLWTLNRNIANKRRCESERGECV